VCLRVCVCVCGCVGVFVWVWVCESAPSDPPLNACMIIIVVRE
jgi:hypothetical protein